MSDDAKRDDNSVVSDDGQTSGGSEPLAKDAVAEETSVEIAGRVNQDSSGKLPVATTSSPVVQENQVEKDPMEEQMERNARAPVTTVVLQGYSPGGNSNGQITSPVFSPKSPQETSERGTRSRITIGPFLEFLGFNLYPETKEEVELMINYVIYGRIAQFVLSLISFACTAGSGLFGDSGNSGINWLLTVGVISFVHAAVSGLLAFKSLGSSPRLVTLFTHSALIGDIILVFCSFSAFSTGATVSIFLGPSADMLALLDLSVGALRGGVVFMFFLWVTFLYTFPMSFIVWKEQELFTKDTRQAEPPMSPNLIANV